MATTQRDVKLVYDGGGGGGSIIATPSGSSLNGIIQSGFPAFQGVAQPTVDLFLDFNDGTDVNTLGINLAGSTTDSDVVAFNNTKTYRKHEWIASGGFDGGGFMRMHWFTGMSIGFSPVWVSLPGGFTPHYLLNYKVRQSNTMTHQGSSVKLLRQFGDTGYAMGTLEWGNALPDQRMKWFFDKFAINPPTIPNVQQKNICVIDGAAQGVGCTPLVNNLLDGGWHDYQIECDYRDEHNSLINISIDGVLAGGNPILLPDADTVDQGPASNFFPTVGSVFYASPFCEMYSCGPQGCGATINTGDFDVDHFSYTILP